MKRLKLYCRLCWEDPKGETYNCVLPILFLLTELLFIVVVATIGHHQPELLSSYRIAACLNTTDNPCLRYGTGIVRRTRFDICILEGFMVSMMVLILIIIVFISYIIGHFVVHMRKEEWQWMGRALLMLANIGTILMIGPIIVAMYSETADLSDTMFLIIPEIMIIGLCYGCFQQYQRMVKEWKRYHHQVEALMV